jgi:hypothetical protein
MLAIAVVTPLRAFAQTPAPADAPPPPPPPPAVEAVPPPPPAPPPAPMAVAAAPVAAAPAAGPKFSFGGLADAYWMYYFNPADGSNSMAQPTARAFDTNGNSVTLALTKLSMNAQLDPVALQVDFGYGATGTIINSNNNVPLPTGTTQIPGNFVLLQAFGTITAMSQGPMALTFDFGKFYTTAGAEVIEANKNWLYSRSLLFNVIPLVHTGARANLKVSDKLSLQLSVVNGWNNDPDNNAWKTVGVNATITINPMISIIPTVYIGKEATQGAGSTPGDTRILADVVVPITISDRIGLNVNVDYINAPNFLPIGVAPPAPLPSDDSGDYIVGVSVMGRFVLNDHAYLAARGEFVRTHLSFMGVSANNNMEEVTAMLGLPVGKNFELRPEIRGDFSSGDMGFDMAFAGGTKKNQFTGTLAALTFF